MSFTRHKVHGTAVLVVVAACLGACTKTIVTGSFNRVPNTAVEYAYINQEADFSRYTKLMSGGLEIYYPEGEETPDPADLEAALARLGSRACLRDRPERCPLEDACPLRATPNGGSGGNRGDVGLEV